MDIKQEGSEFAEISTIMLREQSPGGITLAARIRITIDESCVNVFFQNAKEKWEFGCMLDMENDGTPLISLAASNDAAVRNFHPRDGFVIEDGIIDRLAAAIKRMRAETYPVHDPYLVNTKREKELLITGYMAGLRRAIAVAESADAGPPK